LHFGDLERRRFALFRGGCASTSTLSPWRRAVSIGSEWPRSLPSLTNKTRCGFLPRALTWRKAASMLSA